ncbi:MAG: hypothetical protein PHY71_04780 [Bacteroidaceae bacterium]|nr:hypothetical protein [Bacteroidaceae bacterium]
MILIIKVEVENDLEAYQVLNKTNLKNNVVGAEYNEETYEFNEETKVKDFLKNK